MYLNTGIRKANPQNKNNNGSTTPGDSTVSTSSKNNRYKSAKRKSFLNRTANVEKTPSDCHNHNYHYHHNTYDVKNSVSRKGSSNSRSNVPSSLPVPIPITCTSSSTASSTSSQKLSPSRNYRKTFLRNSLPSSETASHDVAQKNFSSAVVSTTQSASLKRLSVPKTFNTRLKPTCTSKIPETVQSKSTTTLLKSHIDGACDEESSDFRFRRTNPLSLEHELTSVDTTSLNSSVEMKNTSLNHDGCLRSDRTVFPENSSIQGTVVDETLFSQKNTLLEIIQNFSEKNNETKSSASTTLDSVCSSNTQKTAVLTTATLKSQRNEIQIASNRYNNPSPSQNASLKIINEDDSTYKPSILKKKYNERSYSLDIPRYPILKRKSRDETGRSIPVSCTNILVGRKQGILKKYNSLDEEDVARHSCPPDLEVSRQQEFKPILKFQRISSFEEVRNLSPPELHSILKRTKQLSEESSDNGTSPHGILKRKTSVTNGGCVDLDTFSDTELTTVKPILKNKQHSLEITIPEKNNIETPKPILKKKQVVETDCDDDKPMKPILKSTRKSSDEIDTKVNYVEFFDRSLSYNHKIKPILKIREGYRMDTRSVKSDDDSANTISENIGRVKRHSLPGAEILTCRSISPPERINYSQWFDKSKSNLGEFQNDLRIPRFRRNNERYRTQPVTSDELALTRNLFLESLPTTGVSEALTTMDSDVSNRIESHCEYNNPSNNAENNTQEKVDDNEGLLKLKRSNSVSARASLFAQLAKECEKAREEKLLKTKKDNDSNRKKLKVKCSDMSARFSTQPVTWEEVAEAKKQNSKSRDNDLRNKNLKTLDANTNRTYEPISERIKMFTIREENDYSSKQMKKSGSRFKTQPVTDEELQIVKNNLVETSNNNVCADVVVNSNFKMLPSNIKKEAPTSLTSEKFTVKKSSLSSSQSDGDTSSSGGREIRQIMGKQEKIHDSKYRTSKMIATGKDVVDDCPVINGNSSIAQRLAALQKSGQVDWKKRISRIAPEKEVSPIIKINETQELLKKELSNGYKNKINSEVKLDEKNDGSLAERLEKLETASKTWKKRVEPSDAVQFSVVGKMASSLPSTPKLIPSSPSTERKKRGPCPSRFRSFREQKKETQSEPITPEKSKSTTALNRSNSLHSDSNDEGLEKITQGNVLGNTITVPQIFDDDFSTFFGKVDSITSPDAELDFSSVKIETPRLLSTHTRSRPQRKHQTSGNPLKNMANKIEIKNEYREVKTNVAEREMKRMNVEKVSKHSSLAAEALAGLASKEDFAAVQLKKAAPLSSPMLPYKPLMLLHIKGRRHVQTRLVEPVIESINSGDSYILITTNEVYHWIGEYSNVIERSRGSEIAQHLLATHDLGCSGASCIVTINENSPKTSQKHIQKFWTLLGATPEKASKINAIPAGHPDEDEIYESSLISTNMVYEIEGEELVPVEKFWATIPKIQMLDPNKVLIFDFGTELYVWMGKNVDMKLRKSSSKLAKELWDNGFNYTECDLCPITSASSLGSRDIVDMKKKDTCRPDWCLFAKVTQNMETVLFREKFLDWPDFTRVIRQKEKNKDDEKHSDYNFELSPANAEEMSRLEMIEPDLELEGSHLGRGIQYFDEERKLFYSIATTEVRMWHVAEFESGEVETESMGQFYSTDSYVIKWVYSISYTGRELSGQPSKYTTMGRDRLVYFCWQGKNASLNEQGAAALLTVELDEEKGIQKRISQGNEPPAFFNLFKGRAVIYKSKRQTNDEMWRLFICRGELENEAMLLEVSCNIKQLRSRASFVLVNVVTGIAFVWHGCKVPKNASKVCQAVMNKLAENPPPELGLVTGVVLKVNEINEGEEPKEFFSGLGNNSRKLYMSLLNDKYDFNTSPILYHLSSNGSGVLQAIPVWAPCRHKNIVTAYPFLQEYLYSANQPALFLMDSGHEVWLWQGWWPERETILDGDPNSAVSEESSYNLDKDRGSASIRWQVERRAAMQTAIDYWKIKYDEKPIKAYLVWAGLEPIQFTNLFPDWQDKDDVAEMNILDGKKPGEVLDLQQELERLTQSTYPLEQLLQRPLPEGVDPTKLELYLSPTHFKEILKMTEEEFTRLPLWKQTNLKKNVGLF